MTLDQKQWAAPAGAPDFSRNVGTSTAGAITGGALMLLLVLASIIDRTVLHLWGLAFGSVPGINVYLSNCTRTGTCSDAMQSTLNLISFIIITIVWAGLGVAILVGAKRHLAKVAIAGLCAVLLFSTLPLLVYYLSILPDILTHVFDPVSYIMMFLSVGGSLSLPAALLLIALASGHGRLNRKPFLTWAIILLCVCALFTMVNLGITFWNMLSHVLYFVLGLAGFAVVSVVPWIIVAATTHAQRPTPPTPQPEWRPPVLGTS